MLKKLIKLITVFSLFLILGCSQGPREEYAMITFLLGDVKKNNIEAQIGDIVKQDDVLKTASGAFCDVKIGDSIIRVKANSNLVISTLIKDGNGESTVLGLNNGRMLCKPKKLLKSDKFLVKTPTAVAGVRGTQFSVETDKLKTTRIKVFEGKVKVAKRVKQLESKVEKVVEIAPTLNKEEKIIITEQDVKKAEKAVEKSLKTEIKKGKSEADVLAKVISQNKDQIVVKRADVKKFSAAEFAKENKEIIEVEKKPKALIARLRSAIKKTKEEPKALGRLLVTKYDVYFIEEGKIKWEGKLSGEPARIGDKLYVASEDFVFCAEDDGPVVWRKNIINDGKLKVQDGKIKIDVGGKEMELNPDTGDKL